MNPIIWFSIIGVSCLIVFLSRFIASRVNRKNDTPKLEIEPFSVPAYFDRMEQIALDILEKQEPIGKTIILWWGLDGLRLNEDGTLEWISRKKQKPDMQGTPDPYVIPTGLFSNNVFYQPLQSIMQADETQSKRAQIEELMMRNSALQNQTTQLAQSAAMFCMLTQPLTPVYPFAILSPLTQCCCNYGSMAPWP